MYISRRRFIGYGSLVTSLPVLALPLQAQDDWPRGAEVLPWQLYDPFIGRLALLPTWPETRDFSREEWNEYISTARYFSRLQPNVVESVLVAAMLTFGYYEPSPSMVNHWRAEIKERVRVDDYVGSQIMILLRVMFAIPEGAEPIQVGAMEYIVGGCGGYPASKAPAIDVPLGQITAPVLWRDDRPQLAAFNAIRQPGGLATDYQPHVEYRVFRELFKNRFTIGEAGEANGER